MSATVTYDGQQIATVDNETKTLTTAGTWLEDDIEITDASSGGGIDVGDYIDVDTTGMNIVYHATNLEFDGTNYIDTGVQLFSATNNSKDFKIVIYDLYADLSLGTGSNSEKTIISSKREVSPYPGFAVRISTHPVGSSSVTILDKTTYPAVVIERNNGVFSASALSPFTLTNNGGNQNAIPYCMSNWDASSAQHDTHLTLGAALNSSNQPFRYVGGSIGEITVALSD